jgi:hypothetical protein
MDGHSIMRARILHGQERRRICGFATSFVSGKNSNVDAKTISDKQTTLLIM